MKKKLEKELTFIVDDFGTTLDNKMDVNYLPDVQKHSIKEKDERETSKCNNDVIETNTDVTENKVHKTTDWSKCNICNKIFKSQATSMINDKKFHMNKENIPEHKCDHCNALFKIKLQLFDHLVQKHISALDA